MKKCATFGPSVERNPQLAKTGHALSHLQRIRSHISNATIMSDRDFATIPMRATKSEGIYTYVFLFSSIPTGEHYFSCRCQSCRHKQVPCVCMSLRSMHTVTTTREQQFISAVKGCSASVLQSHIPRHVSGSTERSRLFDKSKPTITSTPITALRSTEQRYHRRREQ